MNCITVSFVVLMSLTTGLLFGQEQPPIICSLSQPGALVCTNLQPGSIATVEWAPSASGPWSDDWSGFKVVRVNEAGVIRVSVPMFYRVRGLPREAPPTNPPVNIPANMLFIPAGPYTMGDTFEESWSFERPMHVVYISAFYLDKYEVTKGLWDEVKTWAVAHGYSFNDWGGLGKAVNHPVCRVTWFDAVKWCNARSEMEGRAPAYYTNAAQTAVYRTRALELDNGWVKWNAGYRLPTEAEWEKAARGGASAYRFPWTDKDTITHNQANYWSHWFEGHPLEAYDLNVAEGFHPDYQSGGEPYTSPVGSFAPNGYGLYDMAGNVNEWCWDWINNNYYRSSPKTDPRGPNLEWSWRMYRGGSWKSPACCLRCASRDCGPGSDSYNDIGFRTVLPYQP